MDEEMEDFIEECFEEPSEIDQAYEFDASCFFDFTVAESVSDIEEAERWFEISGDYPPSPFIVKLNMAKAFSVEVVQNSSNSKASKKAKPIRSNSDVNGGKGVSPSKKNNKGATSHNRRDSPKSKTKSATKLSQTRSSSSTLMRPTASHLAKQNKAQDTNSSCSCTRSQRSSLKNDERSTPSPIFENLATKRQKLEIGYLRKVAQLKHQISLIHKMSKKVTIPREPELETLLRAQRRRSKNSSESSEHEKQKASTFRARPLNRKILQAPSLPQSKKTQQLPEFQLFRLKTTERAMQHASASVLNSHKGGSDSGGACSKRPNSRATLKPDKHDSSTKSKSQSLRKKVFPSLPDADVDQDMTLTELNIASDDNYLLTKPPTELFAKLSLLSDSDANIISQPENQLPAKGSENNLDSFHPDFWKCHGKPNKCGDHMSVPETGCWSNNYRSLGII